MAPRNRKEEAFRAGFENPLIGDIGPLQRLSGMVSAFGEELGGSDMGTPVGKRFAERQKATKAEIKRLQELRAAHPEDFGRGMMQAQERMDPYMLGLGTGSMGSMRPLGATRFSPAGEMAGGPEMLEGPAAMRALPAPPQQAFAAPEAAPAAPYYRNVPPEMGTSARPMNAFNQNMYGMSTGRYGAQGYAPEMAVTDFESYGPANRVGSAQYAGRATGFDRNMYEAWKQGRFNRLGGRSSGREDYTPEEMGSAIVPYREGGLVYEPVMGQAQGGVAGRLGGPQGSPRLGYERGPIEGEWSEVYGLGGPRGRPGYSGSMDFGVTREGMAAAPSGMRFDPRLAAAAIGGGAGYMAGRGGEMGALPEFNPNIPRSAMGTPGMGEMYPVMPMTAVPMGATALSGQAPGAGAAFEGTPRAERRKPQLPPMDVKGKSKKGKEQAAPAAAFEPNMNYYVTQALDRLFGQNEAQRGAEYQQYYAKNPWPY